MSETPTGTRAASYDATTDYRAIDDYGPLADCNSEAQVDRDGSVPVTHC